MTATILYRYILAWAIALCSVSGYPVPDVTLTSFGTYLREATCEAARGSGHIDPAPGACLDVSRTQSVAAMLRICVDKWERDWTSDMGGH